jgi:hypothetical protein
VAKGKVNVKLYLSESNANGGGDAKGFELDTEGETMRTSCSRR